MTMIDTAVGRPDFGSTSTASDVRNGGSGGELGFADVLAGVTSHDANGDGSDTDDTWRDDEVGNDELQAMLAAAELAERPRVATDDAGESAAAVDDTTLAPLPDSADRGLDLAGTSPVAPTDELPTDELPTDELPNVESPTEPLRVESSTDESPSVESPTDESPPSTVATDADLAIPTETAGGDVQRTSGTTAPRAADVAELDGDAATLAATAAVPESNDSAPEPSEHDRSAPAVPAPDPATGDAAPLDQLTDSSGPVGGDAPSGADAEPAANPTARLAEQIATRVLIDRIDRHRLLRDGTLEIDVATERFGVLRVEAMDGKDGLQLSLRGDDATPHDLADLADDLRRAFREDGVDLTDVDVRQGFGRSARERQSAETDATTAPNGTAALSAGDTHDPSPTSDRAARSGVDLRL